MSASDLIECRQEILELWARLEKTSQYREALGGYFDHEIDDDWWNPTVGEISRDRLIHLGSVIGLSNVNLHNVKKVRNRIAHNTTTATFHRLVRTRDALRAVHIKNDGYLAFVEAWGADQKRWTDQQRAPRLLRNELLNQHQDLFGSVRDFSGLPPVVRASISIEEFNFCRRVRDRASHPAPPPLQSDVVRSLAIVAETIERRKAIVAEEIERRRQELLALEQKRQNEREEHDLREAREIEVLARREATARAALEQDRLKKAAAATAWLTRSTETRRKEEWEKENRARATIQIQIENRKLEEKTRLARSKLEATTEEFFRMYIAQLPEFRNGQRKRIANVFVVGACSLVTTTPFLFILLSGFSTHFVAGKVFILATLLIGMVSFLMFFVPEPERRNLVHAMSKEVQAEMTTERGHIETLYSRQIREEFLTVKKLQTKPPGLLERIFPVYWSNEQQAKRYQAALARRMTAESTQQQEKNFPGIRTAKRLAAFSVFATSSNVFSTSFLLLHFDDAVFLAICIGLIGSVFALLYMDERHGSFVSNLTSK